MQVNLRAARWELGSVCRLLEMHSQSPARAPRSPPLFCMHTVYFLWIFASSDVPSSVIRLTMCVSVSPAFLRSLHFAFIMQNRALNLCFSCSDGEVHQSFLLARSFCLKSPWILWSFVCVSTLSLQFQPKPCSAVHSLCFLLSHCRPALSSRKQASSSGTDCCVLDGWLAGWLVLCVDVQMSGGLEVCKQKWSAFWKIRKKCV